MIFEAWHVCGSNLEWRTNWPKLMQLIGKICQIKQYLHLINSFLFTNQANVFISYIYLYIYLYIFGNVL
jgi:hypothetical protein